jgi:hypothetical protein
MRNTLGWLVSLVAVMGLVLVALPTASAVADNGCPVVRVVRGVWCDVCCCVHRVGHCAGHVVVGGGKVVVGTVWDAGQTTVGVVTNDGQRHRVRGWLHRSRHRLHDWVCH